LGPAHGVTDHLGIGDVALEHQYLAAHSFQVARFAGAEVVQHAHLVPALQERLDQVRPDEPRSAGHQTDCHAHLTAFPPVGGPVRVGRVFETHQPPRWVSKTRPTLQIRYALTIRHRPGRQAAVALRVSTTRRLCRVMWSKSNFVWSVMT